MSAFRIRRADWDREQPEILAVRFAVFVDEQGVPPELEHDALDAEALHLLAVDAQDRAIGTARLLPNGHVGRMAVRREWRRRGIGSALLERVVALARAQGMTELRLNAQCSAIDFYTRAGFRAEGPVFVDAGIDHRLMSLPLGAGPG